MQVQLTCNKGCGYSVSVDVDTITEAANAGVPLVVAHEVCPTSSTHHKSAYQTVITVHRITDDGTEPVKLASVGVTLVGKTFDDVADAMSKSLTEQWQQVLTNRHVMEEGDFPQVVLAGNADGADAPGVSQTDGV